MTIEEPSGPQIWSSNDLSLLVAAFIYDDVLVDKAWLNSVPAYDSFTWPWSILCWPENLFELGSGEAFPDHEDHFDQEDERET